ncbi:MAG: hypothetical protein ACLQVF_32695 [Isosphaeraceae bacterium]
MSDGLIERLSPRNFYDGDRLLKPIPCNAKITEWLIPERVLNDCYWHQVLGYSGDGAIVQAERADDETIWLFVGCKPRVGLFASAIAPVGAAQILVRAGIDLPYELQRFGVPLRHPDRADPPSDTSTPPETIQVGESEPKGTPRTQKSRRGRRASTLTKMERDVWDLYCKQPYKWGLYHEIAEILEPKHPGIRSAKVEQIVRKIKARNRQGEKASKSRHAIPRQEATNS